MIATGLLLALFSGIANGLFSAPLRLERRWRWENTWAAFIVVSCLLMPALLTFPAVGDPLRIFSLAPPNAVISAILFGFLWGFGAICFGLSVDRLGVSVANSLVIGLSSALGSIVPLLMTGALRLDRKQGILFSGILAFLLGVWFCGQAGRLRDDPSQGEKRQLPAGYLFALGSGIMSAVFNVGYSLALPIANAGVVLGYSQFSATNCIWLLMLGAGSIPNLAYCVYLMSRNHSWYLLSSSGAAASLTRSTVMGLLWGGSIFLYGAATPRLGELGPAVGWPLSLAAGLLFANLMGLFLGEWRGAVPEAARKMRIGVVVLFFAILICAYSTTVGA